MKKTLIALAALAATGAAFAQSSVSIYGRLDVGYSNNVINETVGGVAYEARANGVANDTLNTSYWGLKGSEDLGGGLKANFNLEQTVAIDSGSVGTGGFARISTLGLSGGFGTLNLGRFYTPLFQTVAMSDVFGQARTTTVNLNGYNPTAVTTGSAIAQITGTVDVRSSGGIFYETPNFSGFSAKIMLAPKDATVTTNTATGTSSNTGLSGTYANGPLVVSLAWGEMVAKNSTATPVESKGTGTAIAGSYNFGAAKLFAGYTTVKLQTNTAVDSYGEKTETNLGVSVPMGKTTLMAALGRNTGRTIGLGVETGSANGNDWIVGASYELSKRTAAYVKTGVYNKYDFTGGDTKTTDTTVGIRHLF